MNSWCFWQGVLTERHYLYWQDTPLCPPAWLPMWQPLEAETLVLHTFPVCEVLVGFVCLLVIYKRKLFASLLKTWWYGIFYNLPSVSFILWTRIKQFSKAVSTLALNKCCGRCSFCRTVINPRTEWFVGI